MPIETDYLLDVIPQEMGTNYHPVALQAQAIAARTYAYWHRENGYPIINNSASYQVFIPYKFESLPTATFPDDTSNPCASSNLNPNQQIICGAVTSQKYISFNGDLPAFSEFSADAQTRTQSNATDRAGSPSPYLLGVEEPISTTCDAENSGHGHGMSQEGASRWARGNQCSYTGPGNQPWSVAWGRAEQILVHYYTGVHIRDASATPLTSDYRWNPLSLTWSGSCPPLMTHGQSCTVTVRVQNTGISDWVCGQYTGYILSYRWAKAGQAEVNGASQVSLCNTNKGDPSPSATLVINDIPNWGSGAYTLKLDMARTVSNSKAWFSTSYGWPSYDVSVCVDGSCKVSMPQIVR
ncbi:MAG: hypothetical protein KF753_16720 [Caldilineaceae bacterium]|nr:hypothetical protein [Caldilineaceae bacterium]